MSITKHYCDSCGKEMKEGGLVALKAEISNPNSTCHDDRNLAGEFCCYSCMSDFVKFGGKPPQKVEAA